MAQHDGEAVFSLRPSRATVAAPAVCSVATVPPIPAMPMRLTTMTVTSSFRISVL